MTWRGGPGAPISPSGAGPTKDTVLDMPQWDEQKAKLSTEQPCAQEDGIEVQQGDSEAALQRGERDRAPDRETQRVDRERGESERAREREREREREARPGEMERVREWERDGKGEREANRDRENK